MNDDKSAGTFRHRTGLIADIRDYLNVVRRYWWLVGLTTVLSVGLALWLQRSAQPQYSAEVLMQQRVDAPLIGDRGRISPTSSTKPGRAISNVLPCSSSVP
jgi:hypothetical protein